MSDLFSNNKFALIGIVLLVAGVFWFSLSGGDESSSLLVTDVVSDGGPDAELVATLLTLRAVKLDGTIFSDPAFLSLKDFSTSIKAEPVGRPNPFARIGVVGAPAAATPGDTQVITAPRR
jgi:hypothetical protein